MKTTQSAFTPNKWVATTRSYAQAKAWGWGGRRPLGQTHETYALEYRDSIITVLYMSQKPQGILAHFSIVPDPRRAHQNTKLHTLSDIICIAVLAVIAGANSWNAIAEFGEQKETWLRTFLTLKNGIPSHDTFARVFSILNTDVFETCFTNWVQEISSLTEGSIIALDGKSSRRAHGKNLAPLHIVNAFATQSGIALGQRCVDGKSNEITAIPLLLDELTLKGCIVTTDAMGAQVEIAKKIKDCKADYVLALKGNQGRLHEDVQKTFTTSIRTTSARSETHAHGRTELRECMVTDDLSSLRTSARWEGLTTIAQITDTRTVDGKTTVSTRYFISSLPADPEKILAVVRAHWKIENSLHWVLDVIFREDESRIRSGHAQKNFALLRKFALNLLRKETTTKGSLITKRFRAGLCDEYLKKVIGI